MKSIKSLVAGVLVVGVAAGCSVPEPELHVSQKAEKIEDFKFNAEAGVRREPGVLNPEEILQKADPVIPRGNPFALKGNERAFELDQRAANLLASQGYYQAFYEEPAPPPSSASQLEFEPQPDRRLVGIMRGDTVSALIDMGQGSNPRIFTIYPGMVIEPNGTWMVRSIDDEKAVLERVKKDKRPFRVTVYLSPNLGGGTSSTQGGGGAGGGGSTSGGGPGTVTTD